MNDFERCCEMAREFADGHEFNGELFDRLFDFAHENCVDVCTDYETYVMVEDEVFYFQF